MFQKLEPYVVYEGFSMGSQPSSSGMSEIQDAIWNNEKVIIIIDDSNFASRVTDYLTIGRSCLAEGEDETMMQRACFLCSSADCHKSSSPSIGTALRRSLRRRPNCRCPHRSTGIRRSLAKRCRC